MLQLPVIRTAAVKQSAKVLGPLVYSKRAPSLDKAQILAVTDGDILIWPKLKGWSC